MDQVGNVYLNFAFWAVAILPTWLVIREYGTKDDVNVARDEKRSDTATYTS